MRSSKSDYARYYLRTLEAAHAGEKQPWHQYNDDPAAITLEHVLPKSQKPGTWTEFTPDDAERYLKRLGNMCLLQRGPNSTQDNDTFEAKKSIFKQSPYYFTNHIADWSAWTPQTIEERQRRMAQLASKAWPI